MPALASTGSRRLAAVAGLAPPGASARARWPSKVKTTRRRWPTRRHRKARRHRRALVGALVLPRSLPPPLPAAFRRAATMCDANSRDAHRRRRAPAAAGARAGASVIRFDISAAREGAPVLKAPGATTPRAAMRDSTAITRRDAAGRGASVATADAAGRDARATRALPAPGASACIARKRGRQTRLRILHELADFIAKGGHVVIAAVRPKELITDASNPARHDIQHLGHRVIGFATAVALPIMIIDLA